MNLYHVQIINFLDCANLGQPFSRGIAKNARVLAFFHGTTQCNSHGEYQFVLKPADNLSVYLYAVVWPYILTALLYIKYVKM